MRHFDALVDRPKRTLWTAFDAGKPVRCVDMWPLTIWEIYEPMINGKIVRVSLTPENEIENYETL